MEEHFFGWTTDPVIIAIISEVMYTSDHELLSNRKDGGIHKVWLYPLGHFDDDEHWGVSEEEPIFTRVDVSWGRYMDDGVTFLVWEEEQVRAGTVEDAIWLRKGINEETRRTQARARNREARQRHRVERRREHFEWLNLEIALYPLSPVFDVDFAALLPEDKNGG